MIGGIPNASVFPKSPSLIAKDEPKSFVDQVREKNEALRLNEKSGSSTTLLSKVNDLGNQGAPAVRYGQAASAIEPASSSAAIQKIPPPEIERPVDRPENSLKEKSQQIGVPVGGGEKRVEIRSNPASAHGSSPPLYEQLKKEYFSKALEESVGNQFNAQA